MFEIAQLKEKKLTELQDIAKTLKIPKFRTLKKLDLVYKILDVQAESSSDQSKKDSSEIQAKEKVENVSKPKQKRARIRKVKDVANNTDDEKSYRKGKRD